MTTLFFLALFAQDSASVQAHWNTHPEPVTYSWASVFSGTTSDTFATFNLAVQDTPQSLTFCVSAVDSVGNESPQTCNGFSVPARFAPDTTPPSAPSGLDVQIDTFSVSQDTTPSHTNEPDGMSVIMAADGSDKLYLDDQPLLSSGFYGTKWLDDSRVLVVDDPAVGKAVEKRFLAGDTDGWNGTAIANNFVGAYQTLYIRLTFLFSENWEHHSSGAHKLILFGDEESVAANNYTINARGTSGAMRVQLTNQGGGGIDETLWISNEEPLTLGEYHTVELVIVAQSDAGSFDGSFRMWADGQELTFDKAQSNLQFSVDPPPENFWDGIQTFLYWGGGSDTKTVDDFIRISEIYVSGK